MVYGPVLTLTAVLRFRPRNILTFDVCRWERTRLGMSNDGARAAFVEAFFEVAGPKIKKVSVAIEVICVAGSFWGLRSAPWYRLRGPWMLLHSLMTRYLFRDVLG